MSLRLRYHEACNCPRPLESSVYLGLHSCRYCGDLIPPTKEARERLREERDLDLKGKHLKKLTAEEVEEIVTQELTNDPTLSNTRLSFLVSAKGISPVEMTRFYMLTARCRAKLHIMDGNDILNEAMLFLCTSPTATARKTWEAIKETGRPSITWDSFKSGYFTKAKHGIGIT